MEVNKLSVKTVNILGFVGYKASVITTQLCQGRAKSSHR